MIKPVETMKYYSLFFFLLSLFSFSQTENQVFSQDTILIVNAKPEKGFQHSYILFIPKETPKGKLTYLLVEPNNTGRTSDSISVHQESALHLASVSSVGNNIAAMLKIPLLVPVFPRPDSEPLVYTHALDRDVMLEKSKALKRLDLQLIAMLNDAHETLKKLDIPTHDKVFMNGFSASGSFTNRFLFLHPEIIKAAAMGGFNGELMLPLKQYHNRMFNYPLGIGDFKKLFHKPFDRASYKKIPQYIYMGQLDTNDAVQFDDAYNDSERKLINHELGDNVQERWKVCQSIYTQEGVNARFTTYEEVGHWTTSAVNMDVIKFFFRQLQE